MLISLNWLKDFIKIPRDLGPAELARLITTHTAEVERAETQAERFAGIVVGEIREVKPHPNAERLQLVLVATGRDERWIVCGATNIAAGQKVPVALPGAIVGEGLEIKETVIRGEKSAGMLCAEDELGLGEDHAGIKILGQGAKVGENLAEHLGLDDIILEIDNKSITHRPDLWSHYGIARELAALMKVELAPLPGDPAIFDGLQPAGFKVTVKDGDLCPRYLALEMEGLTVAPSPDWLAERLVAAGMRPINNIVDITNYVMLELGQPLHAFDRRLAGEIVVRRAADGETITTLDGKDRKLTSDHLVIADKEKPIGIAGIMGGRDSEIAADTGSIVIESANFDFLAIRRAQSDLGLRTDASVRFEKALDPELALLALRRAAGLVLEIVPGAKIAAAPLDIYAGKPREIRIELDPDWIRRRLGLAITDEAIIDPLKRLGFAAQKTDRTYLITVPGWRATRDISIPEDLLEEVARMYGYDHLAGRAPVVPLAYPAPNRSNRTMRRVRAILAGAPAMSETMNYSFLGKEILDKFGIETSETIRLANPISATAEYLRTTLAPGLILNIRTNQARTDEIALYEFGSIYLPIAGELPADRDRQETLPYQERRLGLVVGAETAKTTIYRLKSAIEMLAAAGNVSIEYGQTTLVPSWAEASASSEIVLGGKTVGSILVLSASRAKALGVKKAVAVAEIALPDLEPVFSRTPVFRDAARFPAVLRDLCLVVDDNISYAALKGELSAASALIRAVELFDVYEGSKLGAGKKSLAFHIAYQADRTLTAAEVEEVEGRLKQVLEEKYGAKVRDF